MSDKRKRIFKESLFIVPFLLVVTVVSLVMMFGIGRTVRDTLDIVRENMTSDSNMNISTYTDRESKKYTLKYYYGEKGECTEYAEFTLKAKSDDTTYELTLFEARDGFEAGYYKTEWFYSTEYVTYAPLTDKDNGKSYPVEEEPYMYEYIKSYSYENLMESFGATTEVSKGYKILGLINLYTWDSSDRVNCIWGIGSKPMQFYTYLNDNTTEYKKVTLG